MKFSIDKPVEAKHMPLSFYVEVEMMSGDADATNVEEFGPFKGTEDLTEFITVLDRMKAAYPNGRLGGGRNNFDHVEGFAEWFVSPEDEDAPFPLVWKYSETLEEWPSDVFDYETHADPYDYKIFYYDSEGTKLHVSVEK